MSVIAPFTSDGCRGSRRRRGRSRRRARCRSRRRRTAARPTVGPGKVIALRHVRRTLAGGPMGSRTSHPEPAPVRPTDTLDRRDDHNPYRLPRHVLPHRTTSARARPRRGDVRRRRSPIAARRGRAATDELVLNAAELEIGSVEVSDGGRSRSGRPGGSGATSERLVIRLGSSRSRPVRRSLTIEFTGVLNDRLRGFYRSTFRDEAGVEHVIATTQMQATDCRRAFPCWDEPDFKAVFGDHARGRRPACSPSPTAPRSAATSATARSWSRFADTMVMSTYLVAVRRRARSR